ncbi:putative reverse transcriptase domain-containing protein [Tanacetum coccineum]
MVSTMTICNTGRRTAITRGRGTSEQDGREGERSEDQAGSGRGYQRGGRDGQESDHGSQRSSRAQVGNHVNNQGNNKNQDDNVINDNNQGNVRTRNNGRGGCSYKESMACNLKDYDGKGGAREPEGYVHCQFFYWQSTNLLAMPPTLIDSMSLLGYSLIWLPLRTKELRAGMLTDEAIRNGALKKVTEKRGNNGEPSRDGNARNDNKRSRTGRAFATTTNPVRKKYTGTAPKCPNCNYHHQPEVPCRLCTNCNRFKHIAKDCRVGPRIMNPLNARNSTVARGGCFECGCTDHYKASCSRLNRDPRPGGNRPNQVMAIEGGQGCGNNGNYALGRDFVMGAEEAHQDPNIVTGTFTLNKHYATTLFDSGADYSFVSTTFIPLLEIEPNNLSFSYEIEIASDQLVEINKVIRGFKIEIVGHIFDIDLIPFRHRIFDVIVGMNWLSRHKAKIVFHEKVVRIPLPNREILRVFGEKSEEKVRHSKSAKVNEQKLKDTVVFRNFFEVFPNDLSGLPPLREIEFRVVKSTQRTPGQGFHLTKFIAMGSIEKQFLGHVINGDGLHVDSSKIKAVKNWEAPSTPTEDRSFLRLAGYYRQFIENFSKLAKPLTILTQNHKEYVWGEEQERTFKSLKDKLCNAPVLALLDGPEDFVCMRTRSSSNLIAESSTTLKHRNRRRSKQRVEPFSLEESPVVTMADQRTMAELLQAPTEGYGDAIVIPAILAENFELKHGLLNLDLLRTCPHHCFTELHQLDTFYNALTPTDQDSLNAAAGGNLLTKTPRDALTIIENKSKVHNSQNKPIVSKVSTNAPSSSTPYFLEIATLVDAVKAMLHQKSSPPASVKAVEEIYVTCGGPHPYHQCLATDGNVFLKYQDNIQGYVSTVTVNYNQGNIG